MLSTLLLSTLLLPSVVSRGLNDWKKPCFEGECHYDLPQSNGRHASGSLKIWGAAHAISDITTAAGWTIIGCYPDALAQDIRIVCNSEDAQARCNHLYTKFGAVGKLVRLPENCGKSAFARVARAWVPKDQSIPQDIAEGIVRRAGVQPLVMALTLDTNFAAINPAVTGEVSIAITGTTIPGAAGNLTVIPATTVGSTRRGLFDWIKDAWDDFNNFDESVTKNLTPLDISKNYPLFSQSISCAGPPAFTASVSANLNTEAHATISLGLAAVGTIIPPKLTEFGAFVGLDAQLEATLGLVGSASATADTGELTLFQVGIPGLDFPGILTIGPSFKIIAQATAHLDVGVNMVADISYTISGAKIMYPPSSGASPSKGIYTPGTAPLKLSVSGNLASTATAFAHITPRIDLGISALGGIASAQVFVDLDAHASVTMNLDAVGSAGGTVDTPTGGAGAGASASIDGCISASAGLDANVGADASFFGLFDKSTTLSLFAKDWQLFQKCFAAQTAATATTSRLLPVFTAGAPVLTGPFTFLSIATHPVLPTAAPTLIHPSVGTLLTPIDATFATVALPKPSMILPAFPGTKLVPRHDTEQERRGLSLGCFAPGASSLVTIV